MASPGTFATALNCMDGRCQEKALAYVKGLTNADHVDMVTEPGIDGLLAGEYSLVAAEKLPEAVEWVKVKAGISANGHGSKTVVIFGHCGCAGNVAEKDAHVEHLKKAKATVEGWSLFETVRIAVFNDAFEIEEIA